MGDVRDEILNAIQRLSQRAGVELPPPADHQPPLQLARQAGLDATDISRALADALQIGFCDDLPDRPASADFVDKVPIAFARQHRMLGLRAENGRLPVAIADLAAWEQLQAVSCFLGRPVEPLFAPADAIAAAINQAYQQRGGQAQSFIDRLDRRTVLDDLEQLKDRNDLLDSAGRAPVIKLVNLILFEAVQARASDVHVQPYESTLVVRMRIDGVLYDSFDLPKALQDEVVSRVKVMGRMNIAEKRLAQDGRATVQVGDRTIDLRIASLPTSFGERIVIRLLDTSLRLFGLDEIGMSPDVTSRFRRLINHDHGIILVTGPTGSGKTTTLYAALQQLNSKELNILTLEDPIEYRLEGISQTQVSDKKGMTFASGLRSVLRQDPDIIMVGEIRDHETAVMAIQSALTGHLVFSTLHTNDAASAIARLLDLGIEPYLLASSLIGVLAQRLVRRVCPHCAALHTPPPEELARIGLDSLVPGATPRAAPGCSACRHTGYSGRTGIFELLLVDDPIRRLIHDRATAADISAAASRDCMRSLRSDGLCRILDGTTTIEEVLRVTARGTG